MSESVEIKQLQKEIDGLKQSLKELRIENKSECIAISNRIKELEDKHSKMELFAIEMKQDMKFYATKVLDIDNVLKDIAKEIKLISNKMFEIEVQKKLTEEKQTNPTEKTGHFLNKLMDNNNKAFTYLIITLCSIALMSFGAKMGDIAKLLIP